MDRHINGGMPLSSLITHVVNLLLKGIGFLDDYYTAGEEGELYCDTYYAVDAHVIALYLEPEQNINYMDVFHEGPGSSTARSLAFLFGDFLFTSSEPLIPIHKEHTSRFLIIPPHDEELLSQLTAIHRKVHRIADSFTIETFEKLSAIFDEYEQKRDSKILVDALRHQVPDLAELFNPYRGPKAALTRFAKLPDSTFQRIDTYLENSFSFPFLDPINDRDDRMVVDELMEEWISRLKKRNVPRKPDYALKHDAEVLAMIEHINSTLQRDNISKRIVLVTGSSDLFGAGEEYIPVGTDGRTFATMYLRHPQAFLSHRDFFSFSSISDKNVLFKFVDWFNLLFPFEPHPTSQAQPIRLRLLYNSLKKENLFLDSMIKIFDSFDNNDRFIGIIKEWTTQVNSVAQERYAGGLDLAEERGIGKLADRLIELREKYNWSVEELRQLVFKESLGAVSTLYSMSVWVGLWGTVNRAQPKGIPAIRYDSLYKEVEKYYEAVVQLLINSIDRNVSQEELEHLRKLSNQAEEADKSLYNAHVIHALAFAIKGHWHATLTLADTAMEICDQMSPDERGVLRGREAAYLACIALRRSAQNRSSLDRARVYLEQAIARENEGMPEDIRFTAERLAICTRFYYFDLFYDQTVPDVEQILSTLNELHSVIDQAKSEEKERVKYWVLRQTYTNYFSLILIVQDIEPNYIVSTPRHIIEDLRTFREVLIGVDKYSSKPCDDPYAHLILNISTAIWDSDPEARENAKNAASQAVSEWGMFFMPYDKERLEFLKRILPK